MNHFIRIARLARGRYRQWCLEQGEAGWGNPVPQAALPSHLSSDRLYRIAVIGAGNQGIAQCLAMQDIPGVELVGVADVSSERRAAAQLRLNLQPEQIFRNADEMLAGLPSLDLVSIATTAPFHVDLACAAARRVSKVMIEKPLDTSLRRARALPEELRAFGCTAAVNYSRRWLLDYRAIRRCIDQGAIGQVHSITVIIGGGEIGMHASHYFDLCRFLLNDEPKWVFSQLETASGENSRGAAYEDPSGFALFQFQGNARAFIDFSRDLGPKDPSILIKGTAGSISVFEQRLQWSFVSTSQRVWTVPFAEPISSRTLFRRVVVQTLSEEEPLGTIQDGLAALEMIYACHLSSRANCMIPMPLAASTPDLDISFP